MCMYAFWLREKIVVVFLLPTVSLSEQGIELGHIVVQFPTSGAETWDPDTEQNSEQNLPVLTESVEAVVPWCLTVP